MNGDDNRELTQAKDAAIEERLLLKWLAYSQLLQGAETLREDGALFWTERWLLRLVAALSARRLAQLAALLPARQPPADEAQAKAALLDAAAEAALGGHDLAPWTPVDQGDGWQAACKRCGQTTWLGHSGLRYSLLAETCPGQPQPPP